MDEGGAGATGGQGQTQPGGLPGPEDDGGDQQGEAEDGEAPRHRGQVCAELEVELTCNTRPLQLPGHLP